MKKMVIFLIFALILSYARPVAAKQLSAKKKKAAITEMEIEMKGIFPRQRYIIHDPNLHPEVIKIAYIREKAEVKVHNPFSELPDICALLPLPIWNNGDKSYGSSNKATRIGEKPNSILYNDILTLIDYNPTNLSDYDIVIQHKIVPGEKKIDKHFFFTFLWMYRKTIYPTTEIEIRSNCGIALQKRYPGHRDFRLDFLLIPISSRKSKLSSIHFTYDLYQEYLSKVKDVKKITRIRKRSFIFSKDTTLRNLEDYLLENHTTLKQKELTDLLKYYKMRIDFGEHHRKLAELPMLQQVKSRIYGKMPVLANGKRNTKQSKPYKQLVNGYFHHQIDPSIQVIDILFGRNTSLYHPALLGLMKRRDIHMRQYSVEELTTFAVAMDPIKKTRQNICPAFEKKGRNIIMQECSDIAKKYPSFDLK